MKRFSVLSLTLVLIFSWAEVSSAAMLSPALQSKLQTAQDDKDIPIIINLLDKADLSRIKENNKELKRETTVKTLKDKADKTQGPFRALLQRRNAKRMIPFWITNAIAVTVPPVVINELATFPGIESITLDAAIRRPQTSPAAASAPEWNIAMINAPALWNAGITGTGAVVANMDTGVDYLHSDLNSRWRGFVTGHITDSWFNPFADPTNAELCWSAGSCAPCELNASRPCDTEGHGTGTMGVIAGDSSGGSAIGVAPSATWIAVKIFPDCPPNSPQCSTLQSVIIQGFQWLINLPAGSAPDVINNSWGNDETGINVCDTLFQNAINALKTAGIEVVFSAGNFGSGASTSVSPANIPGSFSVGSVFTSDTSNPTADTIFISNFSSRGPSPCDGSIYPHIVAPGEDIKLAGLTAGGVFPNTYSFGSGTSFAAPHVAGAAALLTGMLPSLTPSQIETAFQQTAVPLPTGATSPNNDYGYGLLDVAAAYQYAFIHFGNGDVPQIAGLPSSLFFINIAVGSSSDSFTLFLVNQGTADLTVHLDELSLTGTNAGDFVITCGGGVCSGDIIVPSLGSYSVTVQFSPTVAGSESAQLSIASTDVTLNVPLRGNDPIARVQGTTIVATYPDVQRAFDNSASGDVIKMQAATFPESPAFDPSSDIPISLQGGYDSAFGSQLDFTTIQSLTIRRGTVIVRNVILQ